MNKLNNFMEVINMNKPKFTWEEFKMVKSTILTDVIESFTEDYDTKDKIQILRE